MAQIYGADAGVLRPKKVSDVNIVWQAKDNMDAVAADLDVVQDLEDVGAEEVRLKSDARGQDRYFLHKHTYKVINVNKLIPGSLLF